MSNLGVTKNLSTGTAMPIPFSNSSTLARYLGSLVIHVKMAVPALRLKIGMELSNIRSKNLERAFSEGRVRESRVRKL